MLQGPEGPCSFRRGRIRHGTYGARANNHCAYGAAARLVYGGRLLGCFAPSLIPFGRALILQFNPLLATDPRTRKSSRWHGAEIRQADRDDSRLSFRAGQSRQFCIRRSCLRQHRHPNRRSSKRQRDRSGDLSPLAGACRERACGNARRLGIVRAEVHRVDDGSKIG